MYNKYIDATIIPFKSITTENNKLLHLNYMLDAIGSHKKDNELYTDEFALMIQLNFRGTDDQSDITENPLNQKDTVDFKVQISTMGNKKDETYTAVLYENSINLKEIYENNLVTHNYIDFYNYIDKIIISDLIIPYGPGDYTLSISTKTPNEENYVIQSMTKLTIYE